MSSRLLLKITILFSDLPRSLKKFLTDNSRLQVHKDGSGDVLPGAGLTEEGGEGVVVASGGLLGGHVAVRLDAVLQAVQLPAGVAHLDASLANVDRDTFALWRKKEKILYVILII